ncbi:MULTISPECIES: phage GP46 family protein [unclassified Snodgrassella]|uniref:phage GP46 family protein n=1 Tax=unclassified Snodgrassella TaxID=2625236 RepID=UPI0018DB8E84|nr:MULTISPECIES: phage GP46 family protein [unclassified Snodgrassella]MBI0067556.1 phage GP46 family protein [Snodgrassella sp. M0110]MBI0076480.1 phage GP46 family protein [Snodgrassella sp. M0118]MBI0078856.1 phage GP46 family protein [Snodgrassella sp. M0112]
MDREIDTRTGDYSGKIINYLQNAVYLRLMTPLGSYWADKKLGSLLYTLEREKDLQSVSLLAKQYAQQALQPILDDGRAVDISVTTMQAHNGMLNLNIQVTQLTGEKFVVECPVRVI